MLTTTETLLLQLKTLGDPMRARLVMLCSLGECSVSELVETTAQSQPRISQHLKQLCDAGLMERFRDGHFVYYRVPMRGAQGASRRRLLALLPDDDPHAGLRWGFSESVLIDGELYRSCMVRAGEVAGGEDIVTIEGLGRPGALSPLQAAFVEIGLERAAFLHASDIMPRLPGNGESDAGGVEDIGSLLREGQEITVQVIKDPLGTKGARLTTQVTIPSRFLVFIPRVTNVGISQKIESEDERIRLRDLIQLFMSEDESGGYIARTAAEGASAEALRADMIFLRKLWTSISERELTTKPGSAVYEDLPLSIRVMRDLLDDQIEKIRIDSRESYQRVREFAEQFMPDLQAQIEYYPGERPIFDLYGVEDEIHKALERKVQLKSGGYLIFDQTEAMSAAAPPGFRVHYDFTMHGTDDHMPDLLERLARYPIAGCFEDPLPGEDLDGYIELRQRLLGRPGDVCPDAGPDHVHEEQPHQDGEQRRRQIVGQRLAAQAGDRVVGGAVRHEYEMLHCGHLTFPRTR